MWEVIQQTGIAEIILAFLLLFILPTLFLLILRLRKYEALFGDLPEVGKKGRKKKKEEPAALEPSPAPAPAALPKGYPYAAKPFLAPADVTCLQALREALGPEVDVFAKAALWETVQPTDKDEGYRTRLNGLCYDYLVCDKRTGKPLTAVMYKPGRGRPAGNIDELLKICNAAGANVVSIDMAESYDAASLKKALGLPDVDL